MTVSFRGMSELSLDAKGRLAMPARHRETFIDFCDGEIVVTVDYAREKYLLVYPRPHWEVFQEKLDTWPTFNSDVRMVQRLMIGYATDIKMDGSGRILLTPALRKHAGLEKEVVLIGQNQRFELWDKATWKETFDGAEYSEDLAKQLGSF